MHNPKIVKIKDDKYVVMWGDTGIDGHLVRYIVVDATGKSLSELKTVNASITDCEPLFADNKIYWLYMKNGVNKIYQITNFREDGTYECTVNLVQPKNPWDGKEDISWYDNNKKEFTVKTPQQLAGLATLVNRGNTFEGKKINLGNDIFLNDSDYKLVWTPIGHQGKIFQGTFDGNKYTIYNIKTEIKDEKQRAAALFGCVGEQAVIKRVNIAQSYFIGGGIADVNYGMIAFCYNYSYVNGEDAGGICRLNENLIYGCRNYGHVAGSGRIGGIAGLNCTEKETATISQCSNHGTVVSSGMVAAGIAGKNFAYIYNCYNAGNIVNCRGRENRARYLAGISHSDGKSLSNCYSVGTFFVTQRANATQMNPICIEGIDENCYAIESDDYIWGDVERCSAEKMRTDDFIQNLDKQQNSVLPVWMKDTKNVNDGFPITVADISYASGECKIQPELWIEGEHEKITVELEEELYCLKMKCYFNETEPKVTVEDKSIAKVKQATSGYNIILKQTGQTKIKIHFEETENGSSADYEIALVVKSDIQDSCSHENTRRINKKKATCTKEGYTGDIECKDCKKILKKGKKIEATGHSYKKVKQKATLERNGKIAKVCAECKKEKERHHQYV